MKHNNIFSTFLFLALSLGSCSENTVLQADQPPATKVDYLVIEHSNSTQEVRIPGTLIPFEFVEIYPEISGRITGIHFNEGQPVRKGQLLFQLDTDFVQAQLKQVQSDLDFARKDETRKRALWEAKSISLDELEQVQAKRSNLEAQAAILNVQMEKGKIVAPFSGKIGLRQVSEGAFVAPTVMLTSLAQHDKIKIEFSIAERYAASIQTGSRIHFALPGDSTRYEATVFASSSTIDQQNRMLTVRAEASGNARFIPGSYTEIYYEIGADTKSIIVPATALVPILKGQKIWLIRNGMATGVMVEPGLRTRNEVLITGDVQPGDTLILSGLLGLRDGMPVTVKSAKP